MKELTATVAQGTATWQHKGMQARRDSRSSSPRGNQRNGLISWQQQQRLAFPVLYLLVEKEQDVFGKHCILRAVTHCACIPLLSKAGFGFHFFFSSHIHWQPLGRVWRQLMQQWGVWPFSQPSEDALQVRWAACCSAGTSEQRSHWHHPGTNASTRDSSWSQPSPLTLLSPGSGGALFNCLCKWQMSDSEESWEAVTCLLTPSWERTHRLLLSW